MKNMEKATVMGSLEVEVVDDAQEQSTSRSNNECT